MISWTEPVLISYSATFSTEQTASRSHSIIGSTTNDSTAANATTNRTTQTQAVSSTASGGETTLERNETGTAATSLLTATTYSSSSGSTSNFQSRDSYTTTETSPFQTGTVTYVVNSSSFSFSSSASDLFTSSFSSSTTTETSSGQVSAVQTTGTSESTTTATSTTLATFTSEGWSASTYSTQESTATTSTSSVSFYTVESTISQVEQTTTNGTSTWKDTVTTSTAAYWCNATNTIYEAEGNEVLWCGSRIRPSAYSDEATAAGTTTTRTTISHVVGTASIQVFHSSASTATATFEASSQQSLNWNVSTTQLTTETFVSNISAYPPTDTRETTTLTTTNQTASGSTSEWTEGDYFGVNTVTDFTSSSIIVSKWTRGLAYQTTSASWFSSTVAPPVETYETSDSSTGQTSTSTVFGGSGANSTVNLQSTNESGGVTSVSGQTLVQDTRFVAIALKDFSTNNLCGRIVNFPRGFDNGQSIGGWPTIEEGEPPLSFVSQASSLLTVWPETDSQLTVSSNSWTSVSETTTVSGTIGVEGATSLATRSPDRFLGGSPSFGQTMLETATRGAYENQLGETTFFDGDDTTYTSAHPINFWYAAPFYSAALASPSDHVKTRFRNWTATQV